jgi:hypothetical protein
MVYVVGQFSLSFSCILVRCLISFSVFFLFLFFFQGWAEHENLRDERAEAFRTLLWPGAYEWAYTARATTKGSFVVPPAKAEEMYNPENFGRSSTEKFEVIE